MIENKFIIFCPDHFNPLGVIRSLGEVGIRPFVILYGHPSILVKYSKYIEEMHWSATIADGFKYLQERFGNETKKPFLLATSDDVVSYLDLHFTELCDKFYFFNAGAQGRLTHLMEKKNIVEMGRKAGFLVPETEEVARGEMPRKINFPILTKSNTPTIHDWKSNVFICRNEAELRNAYEHIDCDRVILQEYVQKVDEINFEGFSINGGSEVYIPLENRFYRTTSTSFGNYAYIEKIKDQQLLGKIKELLKLTKFTGIFEVEFMIGKDGRYYFLEVNFRNSAWLYAYTRCGVNLPLMLAKSVLANRLVLDDEHIQSLPFKYIDEFTDFKWSVLSGKVNIFKWLRDFFTSDCTFYINRKDPKPFVMYLINRIKKAVL